MVLAGTWGTSYAALVSGKNSLWLVVAPLSFEVACSFPSSSFSLYAIHQSNAHTLPKPIHQSDAHILPKPIHQSDAHILPKPIHQSNAHTLPKPIHQSDAHILPKPIHQSDAHILPKPIHQSNAHTYQATYLPGEEGAGHGVWNVQFDSSPSAVP